MRSFSPDARAVYTVSGFTREVRSLLESSYPELWIEGEVTNLSTPSSGHSYFSLKDDKAQVRCALFRQRKLQCATAPRAGLKVLVRARVSLYESRGDFQLIVDYLEEAGEGALRRALEALKRQLAAEGLFAAEHKRVLPALPQRLGVISSPTGAALRDILVTLSRDAPWLPVVVYPATVQGDTAADSVVAALERAVRRAECDVLIVARGGGSLEDLMAFNDEAVARAVFACPIPVISGVGHETDVTIVDLVADLRAATPTAAAQAVGAATSRVDADLSRLERALARHTENTLYRAMQGVDRLAARVRHPLERIRHQGSRVEHAAGQLASRISRRLSERGFELAALASALKGSSPASTIDTAGMRLTERRSRLLALARLEIVSRKVGLQSLSKQLEHLSPRHVLSRGYAILLDAERETVIDRVDRAHAGQRVRARLADGSLDLTVNDKSRE
jgi:exodeoxyribonuclease VII large subunit